MKHTSSADLRKISLVLYKLFFFFVPLFGFYPSISHAQNLTGFNGLFLIPNAEIPVNGKITFGGNYFHSSINSFSEYKKDAYSFFLNLSYLPFLEFHGLIVRNTHEDGSTLGIGDRTISVRFKPFSETEYIPSLLVGWQNIGTAFGGEEAVHHHSLYLVCTKNFVINNTLTSSITTGYGSKLITSGDYDYQGLFGGIELKSSLVSRNLLLSLMLEYDAERFNVGTRLILFNHFNLLFGYIDMKYASGAGSISFEL